MQLVLFDIDGTILKSGGAARGAIEKALLEVFGTCGDPDFSFDGKTDKQIVRELMTGAGISAEDIDSRMPDVLDVYLENLQRAIEETPGRIRLLPGVKQLLESLHVAPDITLGLLTGNIERGAQMKLAAAGLDTSMFRINAYGSDDEHRPALAALAQNRAGDFFGKPFEAGNMIVIGDTPHDISCGKSLNARTIAVATGSFSVASLESHGADLVFPDLANTTAVIQAIAAGG